MKKNWFIFALCFSCTRLWKDIPIICGWLWNAVLGTKPKRQVFCMGMYNSEIWMETCRLNWYVSHPLITASTSISIWVIPHSNVTNIFPEVPKIQGLIVKMKIPLDYSCQYWTGTSLSSLSQKAGSEGLPYFLKLDFKLLNQCPLQLQES